MRFKSNNNGLTFFPESLSSNLFKDEPMPEMDSIKIADGYNRTPEFLRNIVKTF